MTWAHFSITVSATSDLTCSNTRRVFTRYSLKAYYMDTGIRSFSSGQSVCNSFNAHVATMVTYEEELAVYDILNKSEP